jgi:hypothetical protein
MIPPPAPPPPPEPGFQSTQSGLVIIRVSLWIILSILSPGLEPRSSIPSCIRTQVALIYSAHFGGQAGTQVVTVGVVYEVSLHPHPAVVLPHVLQLISLIYFVSFYYGAAGKTGTAT